MIASKKPDTITSQWMRDASDDHAVSQGCWFDEERGQFAVDWIEKYLRLYEGEGAGQPVCMCKDWQYDATMRLFGWVHESEDWKRVVRRFRKAIIFIPKKNKKSPTLAAWCVYTAFGDGEPGQKCFPTAKDGNQIRQNVMQHVHEMIRQSDELYAECKLNKSTGLVFHEPTRSSIVPLSSDNIQTQKSKEGINGSLFVDEVHVVDKSHMSRISRAGISRPEPLHVEVSTAGDEPESYGFGRFQLAEQIIAGRKRVDDTLAIIYGAPQNLKDEELFKDPLKWIKIANPALGHTVKKGEILSDFEHSRQSLTELGLYKKYRLNIWQQSASPWLSLHDWDQCYSTELDNSAVTFGGLDFSRTTDLTARVLYQPGDIPKCCGHYWLPRRRVAELEGQYEIPLTQWASDGWVTISGDVEIQRDDIHNHLERDAEEFSQLRIVGFDAYNIGNTKQWAEDDLGWEMVAIKQTVLDQNEPCKQLEGMVMSHQLDTCGDPVLRWMIGNTMVRPDTNDNIRPQKTVGGVRKHIDGVSALINAMCVALANPDTDSSYETPGALFA